MDFGETTVIKDLSFDVQAGETFGFLGSNGSGKTTTLRALLGIYQPTAGTLHIDGKSFEPRDSARLGYLPEERGLYKKEHVLDVMVYFGRLKGLTKAAGTLIVGKIISLFLIGLVQVSVFLTPVIVGYVFFRDRLSMPDFDLSSLTFEAVPLIIGALLLLSGFTLFTAVLVAIGAIMPTAKEAGVIFGPLMALIFIPFYAISLILSDPTAPIVQVFTYFPLSAPVTAMLRNGFGTLGTGEAIFIIAMLFTLGVLILTLAVHLFRYGSIQYSSKLNIAKTPRRRPTELSGK
jgi:ABC-type sugar transport system ATPase subunit